MTRKIHWPSFRRGMIEGLGSSFSLGFVLGAAYVLVLLMAWRLLS